MDFNNRSLRASRRQHPDLRPVPHEGRCQHGKSGRKPTPHPALRDHDALPLRPVRRGGAADLMAGAGHGVGHDDVALRPRRGRRRGGVRRGRHPPVREHGDGSDRRLAPTLMAQAERKTGPLPSLQRTRFRVPRVGLEPTQPRGQRSLSPSRLPIPPPGQRLAQNTSAARPSPAAYAPGVPSPREFTRRRSRQFKKMESPSAPSPSASTSPFTSDGSQSHPVAASR
jgi:hypothetical protein